MLHEGDWESPGLSYCPGDLGMGRTVGFQCCVREAGNPRDSPAVLGTWGREGQRHFTAL